MPVAGKTITPCGSWVTFVPAVVDVMNEKSGTTVKTVKANGAVVAVVDVATLASKAITPAATVLAVAAV